MRITFCLSLILVFISHCATAQVDTLSVKILKTGFNYKTILRHENLIYGITDHGQVVVWELNRLDTLSFHHNDTASHKFLCLAKDRLGQLYFGTDKGHVFKYQSETDELLEYKKLKYPVHHIFFNTENHPLFIIANAIYDPIRKKYWTKFENRGGGFVVTKKVLWLFRKRLDKYFNMPQYTFLDSNDRLWMTASFGEFGGSVQVFDAKRFRIEDKRLDSINMGLLFPKSVFEGPNKEIFITSGLQHFSSSGEIYKIDSAGKTTKIFESEGYRMVDRKTNKVLDEGGLFIGPGAYSKSDSCIYFATSRGIHKIQVDTNKQKPEMVINPNLSWEREPLAIGFAMNIMKMEFLPSGSLMFLTVNDGIGILKGNTILLLK